MYRKDSADSTYSQKTLGSNGWKREDLLALLNLVKTKQLTPVIDQVLPLAQGIKACKLLEERQFFGKIVVKP